MSREETGIVDVPDDVHAAALRIKQWAASNMVSSYWALHGLCPVGRVNELEESVKVLEQRPCGRDCYKDWQRDVQEKTTLKMIVDRDSQIAQLKACLALAEARINRTVLAQDRAAADERRMVSQQYDSERRVGIALDPEAFKSGA